jgi:hypothetical protein
VSNDLKDFRQTVISGETESTQENTQKSMSLGSKVPSLSLSTASPESVSNRDKRDSVLQAGALTPSSGEHFAEQYAKREVEKGAASSISGMNEQLQGSHVEEVGNMINSLTDEAFETIERFPQATAAYIQTQYNSAADAFIEENSTKPLEQTERQKLETRAWASLTSSMEESVFFGDALTSVSNWFGLLFVPNIELSKEEIVERLDTSNEDYTLFLSESSHELGEMYVRMTNEEREDFLPLLIEAIQEATDNPLKQVFLLDHYINPNQALDRIDKTLEAAEWISYLAGVAKIAKLGSILPLTKSGGERTASQIIDAASQDPEVAKAAGLSTEAIEVSKTPIEGLHDMTPGSANVGRESALNNLDQVVMQKRAEETVRAVKEYAPEVPYLRPDDEQRAIEAVMNRSESEDLIAGFNLADNVNVHSVKIAPETADGDILVTTERVLPEGNVGGTLLPERSEFTTEAFYWSKNAQGVHKPRPFEQTAISSWAERGVTSPEQAMKQQIDLAAMADVNLAKSRGLVILNNFFKDAYKSIWKTDRKTKESLNQILDMGDANQTVYTRRELEEGVVTRDGTFYLKSEAQQDKYYEAVDIGEKIYFLANHEDRVRKARESWKGFNVLQVNKDGEMLPVPVQGKPVRVQDIDVDSVYVADIGGTVRKGTPEFEEMLKTYTPFRAGNPIRNKADSHSYVLVPKERVEPLPYFTIPFWKGYVPRLRTAENLFVRMINTRSIDGKKVTGLTKEQIAAHPGGYRTIGRALNSVDAKSFIAGQRGQATLRAGLRESGFSDDQIENVIQKGEGKYFFVDTDKSTGDMTDIISQFTNRRSENAIHDISKNTKVPAHISMANGISAVTDKFSTSQVVNGLDAMWHKTYSQYLVHPNRAFNADSNSLNKRKMGPVAYNNAMQHQSLFKNLRQSPLMGQEFMRDGAQRAAELLAKIPGKKGREISNIVSENLLKMSRSHPADKGRAISFQLNFGLYNPRQALVQVSQAAVGASLNLDLIPTAFRQSLMLGSALTKLDGVALADNATDFQRIIQAGEGVISKSDLRHMLEAYKKTGLDESVELYGDWGRIQNGAEMTPNALSQMADHSYMFYRMGEMWQKRINWSFAANRYMQDNPGVTWKTINENDRVASQVHALTEKYTTSMATPNKAAYQRGFASLATQYKSHAGRMAEAFGLLPGSGGPFREAAGWTHRERLRILLTQAAMFGPRNVAAGASLVGLGVLGYEQATGEKVTSVDMPNGVKVFMNGGLSQMLGNLVLGTEIDFGSSLSVTTGFRDMAVDMLAEEAYLPELFFGPLYSTYMGRLYPAFKEITWYLWDPEGVYENGGEQLTGAQWEAVLKSVLSVYSVGNQLQKAMYLHNTQMYADKWGAPTGVVQSQEQLEILGFTSAELAQGAFGFTEQKLTNKYARDKVDRNVDENRAEKVKRATSVLAKRISKVRNSTGADREEQWEILRKTLHGIVQNYEGGDREKVEFRNSIIRVLSKHPESVKLNNDVVGRIERMFLQ